MKSERLIIFLLALVFILVSIFPTINFYIRTPQDSVYTFIHNSISDYPYYISFIRQGTYGSFTTIDQFTTEPQLPGFIHIFYLWLGKLGNVFHLSPINIYFLARIIFGFIFLIVSFKFISFFLKDKWAKIIAFIIFIISTSFPKIIFLGGRIDFWPYLFWWTEMDPLLRATFIPHFLFGHIGLTACLLFLLKLFKSYKFRYLFYSIIIGFIVGFAHPPSLGMIYYILISYLFILSLLSRPSLLGAWRDLSRMQDSHSDKLRDSSTTLGMTVQLFLSFLFILFTIPPLLYIYFTTRLVFPWTLMKAQESLFYTISFVEYLLALGPIFILGLFGIVVVMKSLLIEKKNYQSLILILWVLIDIVMIPLSYFLAFKSPIKIPTFANIRFLSMAIQLPLAILAVYFLSFVRKRWSNKLFWGICAVYAVLTLIMYPGSIAGQTNISPSVYHFVYPKKSLVNAFIFLDKLSSETETVLASEDNSKLLPLFARNKVYFGQSIYTYNNEDKSLQVDKFFSENMTIDEVKSFLKGGNISYVLVDDEKIKERIDSYQFLKIIYEKDRVYIYEVI